QVLVHFLRGESNRRENAHGTCGSANSKAHLTQHVARRLREGEEGLLGRNAVVRPESIVACSAHDSDDLDLSRAGFADDDPLPERVFSTETISSEGFVHDGYSWPVVFVVH